VNTLTEQQQALAQAIVADTPARGVTGRIETYRQAYSGRLIAALRDNFGVLPSVLGDDAFEALALAYLAACPSQRPSIRWFGDRLSDFMAAHDDIVPHPALTDLARMEWALRGAFDAADATPFDMSELSELAPDAWPRLVFEPLPSVQLLSMAWAVEPVWRGLQNVASDEAPELPAPEAHAHTLLVWRPQLAPRWRVLGDLDATLLRAALQREAFGTLCALAAAEVGDEAAAAHAATALRSWLADGLFSRWQLAPDALKT
jgi:hypothetical protein